MERDNHQTHTTSKAEAAPVQTPGTRDVLATGAQIHANDFSPASPSQDPVLKEKERQVKESRSQEAVAPSLAAELGPGFVDVSGDVGGPGHNETFVDIIAVPCPGADPVWTWTYSHEFYSDASIPSDIGSHDVGSRTSFRRSSRPSPWITRDLRMSASIARVFLYRHRALHEGMTLESLSEDLLDQVEQVRKEAPPRPLFFIAHSIGGLVVKSALVRATKIPRYQEIIDSCHGVTFFGTPHRGSSYMSTPNLKGSIQDLLHLHAPLPQSLCSQIRVNNFQLLGLHDLFVDMASELRLWSFYETQESLLSGSAAGLPSGVQFGAPLVSVKSALLDVWQEDVYAVESDHAHLALFEPGNAGILDSYLVDLSEAINKAAQLSRAYTHTPLQLGSHVKVEVIGFYEDPDDSPGSARSYTTQAPGAETGPIIRLYSTTHSFKDFLRKGPERCLAERLHKSPKRRPSRHRHSERETSAREPGAEKDGLHIYTTTTTAQSSQNNTSPLSPEIVITEPLERPPLLVVPHAQSEPAARPASPESTTSVSTTASDSALLLGGDLSPDGPHAIDYFAKQQARILIKEHELTGTAAFCRPNPSLRKFVWIHMPFNNPVWVKEIFATLARTQGRDFSRLFDYDNWVSKQVQNRNSDSQPAYLKAICKYLSAADRIASPRILPPLSIPSPLGIMPNCLYVYIPYLHFDTYHSMIRRRKLIAKRRSHGRAKPVPKWVAQQDSLELKVIWEYIGYDPPLNCRRTLDQFGHHSLRDTDSRDDDQMLYKLTKKDEPSRWSRRSDDSSTRSFVSRSAQSAGGSVSGSHDDADDEFGVEPGPELKNGYVLMIDQLWLWSIDMTTLTTFFSRRESSPKEGTLFQQADLRNSVYNELNGDLTGRTENTLDLAALVVWHAVTVLLDRSSHPDLEIFRVFDEAIGMLAERMTLNMKQFRIHALDMEGSDGEEGLEDSDDTDAEDESPAAIKKRHRRELERSERENRENTSALLELRDLEDELTTLQKLFDTQESTIRQMKEIYTSESFRDSTKNGQEYLDEALEYLDDYKQQTAEMRKRVETTRNDYEKMLEMVQRQAQVDEVRWSRLQAELASSQNLSVMIFTTFTVIFLPLTFFTGLFGMNTIEWQEHVPSLKEIGAISLPASVFLIIVSLVAAFSYRVQRVFRATYKGFKSSWKAMKGLYAERLEPASRKEAKRRRREEKKRRLREAHRAGRNDRNYDFWAMVKRQQSDLRYQIPDQNVNSLVSADVLVGRKSA
ncbi:hypothetical protein C8A03DRAFT_28995 [Achaetomium macrosporum]|uniref:DUF676 domain-containing protein n=1 Tax=Achaetomium macrosporum TaxID=79813 RepID=A0AAN7CIL9_9PEZI|nr:hypothetical protein C8A03DRAFT_28995 [Achaetomium macrosporum]